MQIEEAIKRLEFLKWKINRPLEHTTDDTSNYEDARAIETVLNGLEKLESRCKNLDKEAQSYLEELMGDSTLKDRTINQLNNELEKKDKVIDEILNKFIEGIGYYYSEFDYMSKEEIKEYFYKKASDNK